MAENSSALIVPGHGTVFTAAANAQLPTDPLTKFALTGAPPSNWKNIGHTSKVNTIGFSREGGEATSLDTFLADAVRVTRTSTSWSLSIPALQFDKENLDLAFNGAFDSGTGGYTIPGTSAAINVSLFLLLQDSTGKMGFWLPNTEVTLGDAINLDTENFLEMPLTASILSAANATIPAVNGRAGIMQLFKTGLTAPAGGGS